jgi:DHA2 family metal-tetracycline-proton antiporter-like MFS transporter
MSSPESQSEQTISDTQLRWVLVLLSGVVFMAVVNATMINVALPHIGAHFSVTEGTFGWIVTGYSLTFGIFSAVDGRLADVLGKRRLYLSGIFLLGLTSIALAVTPSIEFTIGLRIFQGAGAAALPALGSVIIASLVPPERRGAAMGVILSTVGVAASIGPFLGGFLVQMLSWRAVFGFTGLVLLGFPVGMRLLPKSLDEQQSSHFDAFGALLLSAGIALIVYAFEVVQKTGFTLELVWWLGGGTVCLVAFAAWIHRAKDPFVKPALFRDTRYVSCAAVATLTNATRFGTIVLVPIFLTKVNGLEPVWVGAALFPGALAIAVLSRVAGRVADANGPRVPAMFGSTCIIVGNLISAWFAGGSVYGVALGMGLYGLGFAFIQTPLLSATSQVLPKELTGVGMGIFMMIFFIGGAIGVALSVTAVELQPADATSWLGWDQGAGARYSNAILVLTGLAVAGAALIPGLPGKDARPAL